MSSHEAPVSSFSSRLSLCKADNPRSYLWNAGHPHGGSPLPAGSSIISKPPLIVSWDLSFLSHFIDACLSLLLFFFCLFSSLVPSLHFFKSLSYTLRWNAVHLACRYCSIVFALAQELTGLDSNQKEPMMEDNDDTVFCGPCSFACLGVLQACMFLGLWSARLAKAQAHESQVALFFSLILCVDLHGSRISFF